MKRRKWSHLENKIWSIQGYEFHGIFENVGLDDVPNDSDIVGVRRARDVRVERSFIPDAVFNVL